METGGWGTAMPAVVDGGGAGVDGVGAGGGEAGGPGVGVVGGAGGAGAGGACHARAAMPVINAKRQVRNDAMEGF